MDMPPASPAPSLARLPRHDTTSGTHQQRRAGSTRSGFHDVSRHTVQHEARPNRLENRPSKEINLQSIQALEEQINEHEMAIVKLKRGRNSLLNVSRLPPEVLGDIFRRNVALEGTLRGFEAGSHNFLLVCHYWSEVALGTPQLWGFWGECLRDWKKWHLRYPTVPLDLMLDGGWHQTLNYSLRKSLQDRAAQDKIQRIHLISQDSDLLDSIISPMAADCEGVRPSSVESIFVWNDSEGTSVDVSNFIAHYRFPKLRHLELNNCAISPWDLLTSRTSTLTTLTLNLRHPTPAPTISQVTSIIDSNPALEHVSLSVDEVSEDDCSDSSLVQLSHLRELKLTGDVGGVFALLDRLDYPTDMDILNLELADCEAEDISEAIEPCIRDHLQRRGRSPGLGLYLDFSRGETKFGFRVGDVCKTDLSFSGSIPMDNFMDITIHLNIFAEEDTDELALSLIACAPQEEVIYYYAYNDPSGVESLSAELPYLKALRFGLGFFDEPFAVSEETFDRDEVLLPHLQHIILDEVNGEDHSDWDPLIAFLEHRASSRNQLNRLEITSCDGICPEVEKRIGKVVGDFSVTRTKEELACPSLDLWTR